MSRASGVDDAMRIVVTGGLGYVGSHLVHALLAAGHQVATVHERLGLAAKIGTGTDVVPEDVACRNFRYRQVGGNELGLCPLARAGWPYEDDSHYLRKPS